MGKRMVPLLFCFALFGCTGGMPIIRGYAVVYGIATYAPDYSGNLTYCAKDAEAFSTLLKNQGYTVFLRTDSDATKEHLEADINDIRQRITEEDTFILYYSGHGIQSDFLGFMDNLPEPYKRDEYSEWIFLYGSLPDYVNNLSKTYDDDQLNALVADIPTNKKIIIIDACNSGGFIGNSPEIDGIPQRYTGSGVDKSGLIGEAFSLYLTYPQLGKADVDYLNAMVVAAAGENEYSYETGTVGHGVFTYYLINSVPHADSDGNGIITVSEVFGFVVECIEEQWNKKYSPYYSFLSHISGGPVDFVLFAY